MQNLVPHLFRTEYSKIVSVLCKHFGLSNIALAEDLTSETFLVATEKWALKGIPENPKAWLYAVAKNKTKDYFKRNKIFQEKIVPEYNTKSNSETFEVNLTEENITDSQLQMLFAICNPIISSEAQIALALRILCGFGIEEIAQAFLTTKQTINKRLQRAKESLRKNNIDLINLHPENITERLDNVLSILYLLFNEGYYASVAENKLSKDLCLEAMRLNLMLVRFQKTNLAKTNALLALFCFHSSRFEARTSTNDEIILYKDQDKSLWDTELIAKGEEYLSKSTKGELSKYHLEAMISFWHTRINDDKKKWESILQLYNKLLQLNYSPVIALNRTYAFSKARNKKEALTELHKIDLKEHYMYHLLAAELYEEINEKEQIKHLNTAFELVNTNIEKKLIQSKLEKILLN